MRPSGCAFELVWRLAQVVCRFVIGGTGEPGAQTRSRGGDRASRKRDSRCWPIVGALVGAVSAAGQITP